MDAVSKKDSVSQRQDWLLTALERLLVLPATEVNVTLSQVAQLVEEVLAIDKLDILFYDSSNDTLVSHVVSDTSMKRQKKTTQMEKLPIVNSGRIVEAFLTGVSFLTGHADQDSDETVGFKVGTNIKSEIATVIRVQGQHRGVLLATSALPEFFSYEDLRFLEAVARWVGIVMGRAELIERKRYEAVEQGCRLDADELVTLMAHGLRNYLTPMRGRIELLEWRARHQMREQDLHDIVATNNTLHQMEQVINDLLDVARLNQGTFVITQQPMNMVDLVQEVVHAYGSEQSAIQVRAPGNVLLFADQNRLRRVLENLLALVVKYTPKYTSTSIEVRCEQKADGDRMILTIYNQGVDIPPEVLVGLFHPFGTDSSPNGLYLANKIVEAHGGTLMVTSVAGQGVQITLTLPVEE